MRQRCQLVFKVRGYTNAIFKRPKRAQADNEKRHLLRFWVDTLANTRPIAPTFAPRSSVQAKGGFKVITCTYYDPQPQGVAKCVVTLCSEARII